MTTTIGSWGGSRAGLATLCAAFGAMLAMTGCGDSAADADGTGAQDCGQSTDCACPQDTDGSGDCPAADDGGVGGEASRGTSAANDDTSSSQTMTATDDGPAPVCGDDNANGGEACDGSDLAGQTCESLGFDGGTLGCRGCAVVTAGCYACTDTWRREFGAPPWNDLSGLVVDAAGDVYFAGDTYTSFDGHRSGGGYDLFAAKLGPDGGTVWSTQIGGTTWEHSGALALDGAGNLLIAGRIPDPLPPGEPYASLDDTYLVKLDPSGDLVWTRQFGGDDDDTPWGIAVDSLGAAYLVGRTEGSIDGTPLAGSSDAFVIKYDAAGTRQWTVQRGSEGADAAYAIALGSDSEIYVAGFTTGNFVEGGHLGEWDMFVMRLDPDGAATWTRQFGAAGREAAEGIAVTPSGDVVFTGWTDGSLFGAPSAGESDMVITRLDADGNVIWGQQLGSPDNEIGRAVVVDGQGQIYATGLTSGTLPGEVSAGDGDALTVKLDADGTQLWLQQHGVANFDQATAIAVTQDGAVYVGGEARIHENLADDHDEVFIERICN